MSKGVYSRKPKMVNTTGEFLNREKETRQKQRHLTHTYGSAKSNRKFCIFCKLEKR
jgi:hypothetical protein